MRRTQFEIWADTFKPQKNTLDKNAGVDGCLFESFGAEFAHVKSVLESEPDRVWTLVESDSGKWYVSQGFHRVNRVGYLISELPYDEHNPLHVRRYASKDVLYV